MKKLLLSTFTLFITLFLSAQEPFYCLQKGAVLEYTTYNPKGKIQGFSRTTIDEVTHSGSDYTIDETVEVFSDDCTTPITKPLPMRVNIKGGNLYLGDGLITVEGDIPFIPSELSEGMELPTGTIKVNSMGFTSTQNITEHRVIGKESITTPAGTFECYIVYQKYSVKVMGISASGAQKSWQAKGVGAVKSETYDKKEKLTSSQMLTKLTR